MKINSINPVTGEVIASYTSHTASEASAIIDSVHRSWEAWRHTKFTERSRALNSLASLLRKRKNDLAILMTSEMGKPISGGLAEIEKCADVCEYYARNAKSFLSDERIETDASKSYVAFKPLGVILAVMPWNFPFWQVFRFLAPALMAGNAGVLKHASNVSGCALEIEKLVHEAGFPQNIFRTVLVPGSDVERLIEHPNIRAVTLTGSTDAGKKVAAKAGGLLKKTVLELGGSDPYIVLEDADLELAAETCVNSRLINSGQSCIAAKRFIVVKSVLKQFTELFTQKMAAKPAGDPLNPDTVVGPQARQDLRDELNEQVIKSVKMGAKCELGGYIPDNSYAFYPATVLTGVKKGMPAYDEELFGPVAAIIPAKNEEEAISIANDSPFGLGAAVFSKDKKRAERIAADDLQAGSCFVNALVKSDPRLPFGGIKDSGYGRELGLYGIREFVNIKSVFIK